MSMPASGLAAAEPLHRALQLIDARLLVLADLDQSQQDLAVEAEGMSVSECEVLERHRGVVAFDEATLVAKPAFDGELVDEVGDLLVDGPAVFKVLGHESQTILTTAMCVGGAP